MIVIHVDQEVPGGAFFESILKEKKPFKSLAIRICAAFLASLVIIGLSVYYFISVSFKQLLTNHTTDMLFASCCDFSQKTGELYFTGYSVLHCW